MYAEGDSTNLSNKCAKYIKEQTGNLIRLCCQNTKPAKKRDLKSFEKDFSIDFGILHTVFRNEIRKFFKTKKLTKGLKADEDEQVEEDFDDLGKESEDGGDLDFGGNFDTLDDLVGKQVKE